MIGVVSSATAGLTTAANTGFTWVEITNLIYTINRAYREGGEMGEGGFNAEMGGMTGYMISDGAEKALRVLLDGDNRPLWLPSTREGVPNTLNGYPLVVNGHMADVAASAIPVLFGNFLVLRYPHRGSGGDFPLHGFAHDAEEHRLKSLLSRAAMDAPWAR